MAARGSVIPLFDKQVRSGQALTITDPNMTYFLTTLADELKAEILQLIEIVLEEQKFYTIKCII